MFWVKKNNKNNHIDNFSTVVPSFGPMNLLPNALYYILDLFLFFFFQNHPT